MSTDAYLKDRHLNSTNTIHRNIPTVAMATQMYVVDNSTPLLCFAFLRNGLAPTKWHATKLSFITWVALFQASAKSSLHGLYSLLGDNPHYKWIKMRIQRMEAMWLSAIKSYTENYHLERKRKKVNFSGQVLQFKFCKLGTAAYLHIASCGRFFCLTLFPLFNDGFDHQTYASSSC